MTIALVFLVCLLGFTLVGVAASRQAKATTSDYLLAGRSVSPWLTALSSVATNNSGFMFIGLIGYAYSSGIEAIWFHVAWMLGDLAAWLWVHRRVRERTEDAGALSVPSWLGMDPTGGRWHSVTIVSAVLSLLFLGGYAAAQLKAGSTTLEVLFGWDPAIGAVLGAVIVIAYSFSGGFRASVWTDAAQSFVMLAAMSTLLGAALIELGGWGALIVNLRAQDPSLLQWSPPRGALGQSLFLVGFFAGGLAAIGQPHILTRTMALDDPRSIPRARRHYFLWFIPFSLLALGVGLSSRALLPNLLETMTASGAPYSAEHALPALSMQLLPDALVGLMLAGIFAATMSTADSQLLVCSAAITQDILPNLADRHGCAKLATLGATLLSLIVALVAEDGVFSLVLGAWGILGASLGPLVLVKAWGQPVGKKLSLVMLLSGAATVVIWRASPYHALTYELLPGMMVPLLLFAVGRSPFFRAHLQGGQG